MWHYTYELVCNETGERYIGKRSSKVWPSRDNYWSSSKTVKAMIKRGLTFSKKVLMEHSSAKEALEHEILLHNLYDVAINPVYLNKAKQTSSGWDTTGTKQPPHVGEAVRRMRLGSRASEEERTAMSLSRKGRKNYKLGYKWYTNGVSDVLSVDCPEGFSKGRSIEQSNNSKSMSGRSWFTDGTKDKLSHTAPTGYRPGRSNSTRTKKELSL